MKEIKKIFEKAIDQESGYIDIGKYDHEFLEGLIEEAYLKGIEKGQELVSKGLKAEYTQEDIKLLTKVNNENKNKM